MNRALNATSFIAAALVIAAAGCATGREEHPAPGEPPVFFDSDRDGVPEEANSEPAPSPPHTEAQSTHGHASRPPKPRAPKDWLTELWQGTLAIVAPKTWRFRTPGQVTLRVGPDRVVSEWLNQHPAGEQTVITQVARYGGTMDASLDAGSGVTVQSLLTKGKTDVYESGEQWVWEVTPQTSAPQQMFVSLRAYRQSGADVSRKAAPVQEVRLTVRTNIWDKIVIALEAISPTVRENAQWLVTLFTAAWIAVRGETKKIAQAFGHRFRRMIGGWFRDTPSATSSWTMKDH